MDLGRTRSKAMKDLSYSFAQTNSFGSYLKLANVSKAKMDTSIQRAESQKASKAASEMDRKAYRQQLDDWMSQQPCWTAQPAITSMMTSKSLSSLELHSGSRPGSTTSLKRPGSTASLKSKRVVEMERQVSNTSVQSDAPTRQGSKGSVKSFTPLSAFEQDNIRCRRGSAPMVMVQRRSVPVASSVPMNVGRRGSVPLNVNLEVGRQRLGSDGFKKPDSRETNATQSTLSNIASIDRLDEFSDMDDSDSEQVPERKAKKLPICLATLARQWSVPLETMKDSAEIFKQYAKLERHAQDDEMLRSGVLNNDAMMKVVCKLTDVSRVEDLSMDVRRVMAVADTNSDGQVDFHEFVVWYQNRAFLECMNLTKGDIENRAVAQRVGCDAEQIDRFRTMFDKFDIDGSGDIDMDEFRELLRILMKTPKHVEIPENRVENLYRECDADGSGEVDFEEFVTFYLRHFDADSEDPLTDYYKGLRRVSISG